MVKNICIVGFGRLGRTLAPILAQEYEVAVLDTNPKKQKEASKAGYSIVQLEDIAQYRHIMLCVPIGAFETALTHIAPHIAPHTTVMDTCSVKIEPVRLMGQHLPKNSSIVASHPLFGPDSIKKGLKKLSIVIWPVRIEGSVYKEWHTFWQDTGLNVIEANPDRHDKEIAATLCMTHFFGRIMADLQLQRYEITTVGYNALYEVMQQTTNDTWELFCDMQRFNPYAKAMRQKVYATIQDIEEKLEKAIK